MTATVQAKMATEVALDLVQASTAIKNLTSAVSASTSAWKSQEAYLRSVGDYAGAARAKYNGLGEAMDAQRRKIEALQEKQRSMGSISTESASKYLSLKKQIDATRESMGRLDTSTEAGKAAQKSMQSTIDQLVAEQKRLNVGTVDSARQYLNFGRQIDQANAKLASMRAQQQRAAQQMDIEDSGVRRLSASMRAQQGLVSATVERLRSQGQAYQALETDLNGTRQRLQSLQAIQQREISLLNQTKERFGENSDQYAKQATRVQQLGTQISETSSKVNELNERMRRTPSGWLGNVQQRLNGIQSGADRVSTSFGRIFGATAAANMFTGALSNVRAQLGQLVQSGNEYNIEQNKMVATWSTLTGSAKKAQPLVDSINNMSKATGQNVDIVNELEQGFYHLNSSKKQADGMTSSLLNMADAVGLNGEQIQAVEQDMVHGMATGKITQGELNQIGQYFPMIDEAMAKHFNTTVAGMRQMAKAGKVTSKDLQDVFEQLGNGKYKEAADNMMNSYFGIFRTIQARTPQLIGDVTKPFMTISNPFLKSVRNWVNDKSTDTEFQRLGNQMARSMNQIISAFGGSNISATKLMDNAIRGLTDGVRRFGDIVASHHTQIANFFQAFKAGSAAQAKIFAAVFVDLSKVMLPVLDLMARFPKTSAALITSMLIASRAVRTLQAGIKGFETVKTVGNAVDNFSKKIRGIPTQKITKIQVDGAQSTRDLQNYSNRLDRLPKNKRTTVTASTEGANRNLNAVQRQAQRIPRRITTRAVANTTQASGNLSRLGTTAMRSGSTTMKGMTLVSRGAGIAKLGLAALGGPAGVIGMVVSGLVGLYQTNGKFRKWVNGMVAGAKKVGASLMKSIGNGVKGALKHLGNLWNSAKKGMGHFASSIKSGIGRATKSMTEGYNGMNGATSRWSNRHTKIWSDTANSTAGIASNGSKTNQGIVSDMHGRLNDRTLRGTAAMIAKWNNHFAQLENTILGAKDPVHGNFRAVMGGIAGPFGVIINGIAKGINWILDKVGGSGHLGTNFTFDGFANGTPNGGLLHDQIALLNDGNGPHYQEMIHKKSTGQTFMLPAQRNMLLPLEAGDEVLDGEKSHQLATMMGMPIPHADGAIGNFFSGIWDKVSDAADDAMDWVEKALKNVVEFGTETFNHFVNAMSGPKDNGHFFSMGVHEHTPHYIAVEGEKWLKKQLESMNADAQGYVSKEKFAQIARHAASLMHQSLSDGDIDHLYWQGNVESGDGANMGAGVDDHDGTGRPLGFYQYKLRTWNSWAVPGHTKIMSILDQTMAVLNDSNWRSDLAPIGTRRGWDPTGHKMFANGGIATTPSIFGEAGAEMAIPLDTMKSTRAWQLMRQVVDYYAGNSANGTTQVTTQTDLEPIEKRLDAALSQNQQLINLIDKLIGVTDAVNNPTARYRRTQRDINMAQAQSLGGY